MLGYVSRLQPCLVTASDLFSKTVFSPHLQVAWIFMVPLSVLCTEPFMTTSFGWQLTLFWTKKIPKGRLQTLHLRVNLCPRWLSILPKANTHSNFFHKRFQYPDVGKSIFFICYYPIGLPS